MKEKPKSQSELSSMQQKLLLSGAENLSETDLLGIVLDSPTLARTLAKSSYDWHDLGRAELSIVPRFRSMRIAQVLALVELSRRITSKKLRLGQSIQCSADVTEAYRPRLSMKKQEEFLVLALDSKNRVIAEHVVAKGSLTQVEVDPRSVLRCLIRAGAARAIALHNHPSGDPSPSSHDTAICKRLGKAGELVGIELLDFIIVAAEGATSFRDLGLL